jgi:hypothetical protein
MGIVMRVWERCEQKDVSYKQPDGKLVIRQPTSARSC